MPSLELADGSLRVTYPDSYGVATKRRAASRRGSRPAGASPWTEAIGPTDEVSDALLNAFAAQSLELVEPFELVPATPAGPAGRRELRPSQPGKLRVALDLPEGQDVVVLLELDGFFSWQLPTAHGRAPKAPRQPGAEAPRSAAQSREGPASRVVRFEIDVRPFAPARPNTRSRGGLVARSLIEYLLPSSTWPANIGTVVFAGATNAGTLLAEPDNWKDFVDLYTNLAAGTARSIGFVTGTAPAAEIVGGLVSGIGAFVKYLVSASVTDRQIPGLAAMEPDGPSITGINGTQPGQPVAGTPWHVVSSDFEARLFDDRHEPPELPRELVVKLADGLVDRLMGTKNDLVIDTGSMGSVDLPSRAASSRTR